MEVVVVEMLMVVVVLEMVMVIVEAVVEVIYVERSGRGCKGCVGGDGVGGYEG